MPYNLIVIVVYSSRFPTNPQSPEASRVYGPGFRVQGSRVYLWFMGLGFESLGFRGLGFRVCRVVH